MVSEIITARWCDICMTELDKRVEARSYKVTIDRTAGNIDLCADHAQSVVTPLLGVLTRHGQLGRRTTPRDDAKPAQAEGLRIRRRPNAISESERVYVCLLCPIEERPRFVSESGLRGHRERRHQMVPGSIYQQFTSTRCPLCGEDSASLRALAYHIAPRHPGNRHLTQAYDLAERRGDPYGVVATLNRPADDEPHAPQALPIEG